MALPLAIAAAFAVGCGLYYKYSSEKELKARTETPGDAYRLPRCCIDALRQSSTRGTLAAGIGAFVSTASLVGTSQPERPSLGSVENTAKFGNDAAGLVMMNWEEEASLHADFMRGIIALAQISAFDAVHEHYLRHAREDSDANKFWTRLYETKKARLPPGRRALEDAFHAN